MEQAELISRIDQSTLSDQEQIACSSWLSERSSMHISLSNAIRRGKLLQAVLVKRSVRREYEFTVRMLDQQEES